MKHILNELKVIGLLGVGYGGIFLGLPYGIYNFLHHSYLDFCLGVLSAIAGQLSILATLSMIRYKVADSYLKKFDSAIQELLEDITKQITTKPKRPYHRKAKLKEL